MVADVARGDGADYSVFHIIKLETLEIIGEYQGKPTPDLFGNMINQIGREFGDCLVVVENNSIGYAVLEKLVEYAYPNIYYSIKSTHEYVDQYQAESQSNAVMGFSTTSKTRPLIVAKLEEFIRNELITVNSSRLINEMRTFIWQYGKPQAMRGYNDDLVMSLAIACWIRDTALQINQRTMDYQKAFLNSIVYTKTSFDTTIKGMDKNKKTKMTDRIAEQKESYEHLMWLIK